MPSRTSAPCDVSTTLARAPTSSPSEPFATLPPPSMTPSSKEVSPTLATLTTSAPQEMVPTLAPLSTPTTCKTTLYGDSAGDEFGRELALSSDGNRLAIAAKYDDNENGDDAGLVQVFEWTGSTFTQIGNDLKGPAAND